MAPSGRRPRRRSAPVVSAVTVIALMATVGWALVTGSAAETTDVELTSGSAWLASPEKGYLSMVDGASEQIVATVPTPAGGPGLSVTSHGSDALVTDNTGGTVTLVRGDTYTPQTPVQFGVAGSQLSVVVGAGVGFVVDAGSRVATTIDPVTLQVTGSPVSLTAAPGAGQTLLDAAGRLWVVDSLGTGVNWYDPDGGHGSAPAGPLAELLPMGASTALVDLGENQPQVGIVAEDGKIRSWPCRLGTRAGDDVELLGTPTGDVVYAAVRQSGTLVVASDDDRCGTVVPLGGTDSDFGGLVQSGHFVFVPDRTTGSVLVVDTDGWSVVADLPLTPPSNDLELVGKDGIVFYNDRSSEKAGVLKRGPDGRWIAGVALQKYDPDTGEPAVPITSVSASTRPSAPESAEDASSEPPTAPVSPETPVSTTVSTSGPATAPPSTAAGPVSPTRSGTPGSRPLPTGPSTTAGPSSAAPTSGPSTTAPTTGPPGTTGGPTVTTSEPPLRPPVVAGLTVAPDPVGTDQEFTVSAAIENATGADRTVKLTAADCDYTAVLPATALTAAEQTAGAVVAVIPAQEWGCLGAYTLTFVATNAAGASEPATAVFQVAADASTAPSIAGVTCDPASPLSGDEIVCSAQEVVVGSRGVWTWTVSRAGDPAEVVAGPVTQEANATFVPELSAGSYQVTLTVAFRGATDTRTIDLRFAVVVPDVVGMSLPDAEAVLIDAGLTASVTNERSHQPANTVTSSSETGTTVYYGDEVPLVVSDGSTLVQRILDLAPGGSWYSGSGSTIVESIPWGAAANDKGFANRTSGVPLEDGTGRACMQTHPRYEAQGFVQGWIVLDEPVIPGDRFRAQFQFLRAANGNVGSVTYQVEAILANGFSVSEVVSGADTQSDGVVRTLDVDPSSFAGARTLIFTVRADGDSSQDWACWVDARVE